MAGMSAAVFRSLALIALLVIYQARALVSVADEEALLSEAILEQKQNAYAIDGARDLQDDPTQYCTSLMEATTVNNINSFSVQSTYPVSTGYPNDLRRCAIFKPTNDIFVSVEFTFLSTELNFDFVEIYAITSYDTNSKLVSGVSSRLLQISGVVLPANDTARRYVGLPGQTLMIVLRTDSNRNVWTGYRATVKSQYRDCLNGMQVVRSNRNIVSFSDGYATAYPPNFSLCWVVIPPRGEYANIVFTVMNTEKGVDLVEVAPIGSYDLQKKEFYNKGAPLGIISGLELPPPFMGANDQIILIKFRSDDNLQFSGFAGKISSPGPRPTFSPTRKPTTIDCEHGLTIISAPTEETLPIDDGFTTYPLNAVHCYVIVPAANDTSVNIKFSQLNLHRGGSDVIEIFTIHTPLGRDIADRDGDPIAVLNGNIAAPYDVSGIPAQTLVIQMRTDATGTSGGFKAVIKSDFMWSPHPTPAPTTKECFSSLVQVVAPPLDQEVVITEGMSDESSHYPPNYQHCIAIRGVKNQRLEIIFDEVDIGPDRIDVFPIKNFNIKNRSFRGKGSLLRRITTKTVVESTVFPVVTTNTDPVLISLRSTGDRATGKGFKARVRSVTPPPTPAPAKVPVCGTRMSLLQAKPGSQRFEDGYNVIPRGSELCWVIRNFNDSPDSYTVMNFDSFAPGTNAFLSVGSIGSYDVASKNFTDYRLIANVLTKGTRVQSRPGETVLVKLSVEPTGTAAGGFIARYVAPCVCSMYGAQAGCLKATCGCMWVKDTGCVWKGSSSG